MRPWARRAAMTALAAVCAAVAGGGLCGTAFAGTGEGGSSGLSSLLGGNGLLAPVNIPAGVCGDVGALLGIALAGCRGIGAGAVASFGRPRATGGGNGRGPSGSVSSGAVTRGAGADGPGTGPASTVSQGAAAPGPGSSALRQTFGDTLDAPGPGAANTDTPAASQLAGLGTLPGPAGLPSLSGRTNLSAPGGSTLMPSIALRAADASGMSSDSFAALAAGALLAGAVALKIASRRARDRKAGIGATI